MDGAATAEERAGERGAHTGQQASEDPPRSSAEDAAPGVGILCCQDCGEAFREEAAYVEHRCLHLQENMYLKKAGETANFCTLCSLSFTELSEFHSHMEKTHSHTSRKNSTIQQQSYECPDCGKCYVMIGHLLNHQRSHRQASKSVFHDLEHLKKKSFQCESCGRSYSRASALDAHRRCHEVKLVKSRNRSLGDLSHTEESVAEAKPHEEQTDTTPEKLYECSCGKSFTAMMRLKTHQRFSRNSQCAPEQIIEKPKKIINEFNCSECDKSFSGHIALFNHQRWHANHADDSANRFSCEECGKVFMTLTFYYRHQRTVHSVETPAKSFLHQVCQLQKKAFECKDCGLKFSRASALQSHQLHHTNVYGETEKESHVLPLNKTLESESTQTEQGKAECESFLPEENVDEDAESYELGDFNVQIISESESEDERVQDQKPDLELLCESDQEAREDDDLETPGTSISKPEMDLKIVQIDFEQADTPSPTIMKEEENKKTEERFDCPDCYRWFTSRASLRVHRMWHGIHKRRREAQVNQSLTCKDCGLTFTCLDVFKSHLHQHALDEDERDEEDKPFVALQVVKEEEDEVDVNVAADSGRHFGQNGDEKMDTNSSSQLEPSVSGHKPRQVYICTICRKAYTYHVSFLKHQELHGKIDTNTKPSYPSLQKYDCPECGMSFYRQARLLGHLRVHKSRTAKPPSCDQCNRKFVSIASWMAHVDLHARRPFWCLSCARGFVDEASLDKHLLGHSGKKHVCKICQRSFINSKQLILHQRLHSVAKPFQCSLCGKSFSFPGHLLAHRKKHFRRKSRLSRMPLRIRKTVMANKGLFKKRTAFLPSVTEETGEQLTERMEYVEKSETHIYSSLRKVKSATSLQSDSTKTPRVVESEQEAGDTHTRVFREWECCVCDMGFDEVEKLHSHYIQHATGEIAIPQDEALNF